jgi:hypothetical protein
VPSKYTRNVFEVLYGEDKEKGIRLWVFEISKYYNGFSMKKSRGMSYDHHHEHAPLSQIN